MLEIGANGDVDSFREKNSDDKNINCGFMVLEPQIFDYLDGDSTVFERAPLERLADEKQLVAYEHDGFWKCMDNQREKDLLEEMWKTGNAPWKVWK